MTPFLTLGLWGLAPEQELTEARDAFAMGDLAVSAASSDWVASTWASAESVGQNRAISIGLIVLALVFALAVVHRDGPPPPTPTPPPADHAGQAPPRPLTILASAHRLHSRHVGQGGASSRGVGEVHAPVPGAASD